LRRWHAGASLGRVVNRRSSSSRDSRIKAVLGPTNTGKTHLAIERLCAHSSGAIGFPLRLLAREVYDKVCAIKGPREVALITGEERIEPPDARWLLCTAEAMPHDGGGKAFVALDEAQLAGDRDRGHIFTDRLLNARGREETMLLGSATIEPLVRSLIPEAEIIERPRFSTLSHAGSAKLSRLPPRSAIVAFSAQQVYVMAEMLRRFRGGAAVVMGALSPETRNRQVELFQSGEVDYIVATDAIGMGLNLDVTHVAFAGLTKFDGQKQRRLSTAEMAQIAGRAGRHQKDGSFGTLAGGRQSMHPEFTEEEIYAIEEHRFAPLTKLLWREAQPRFDTVDALIGDLESKPDLPELAPAPEAIDLAVLKRLSDDPEIAATLRTPGLVKRFWDACSLPDFRQQGAEMHGRFVARLWQDLRRGELGSDYVAARISDLDNVLGDIDTLQGRIASIRSWAYIAQRPDWVLAREEMAARARKVEARLSDALHGKLTERFVNRRTAVLMKTMGKDSALLKVALAEDGAVTVEGEQIGHLEGFRFVVDAKANHEDRKLLLAAAEKHLPQLLAQKASALVASELGELSIAKGKIMRGDQIIALLQPGRSTSHPRLELSRELGQLDKPARDRLEEALGHWLEGQLAPLEPLRKLEDASADPDAGSEVRALLLSLLAGHGVIAREDAGLKHVPAEKRPFLRKLGVFIGTLDVFAPALLKPAPRALLQSTGADRRPLQDNMAAVIEGSRHLPAGYRRAGRQAVRVDMAEKLFRAAHEGRVTQQKAREAKGEKAPRSFLLDTALGISMGLSDANLRALLRDAGFRPISEKVLAEGAFGPPEPLQWTWRAPRRDDGRPRNEERRKGKGKEPRKGGSRKAGKGERQQRPDRPAAGNAFAALADLLP
jgi:ATP-dependent RNA helicase SUPV3L1/SUV3